MEKKSRMQRQKKRPLFLLMLGMITPLLMGAICDAPTANIPTQTNGGVSTHVFGKFDFSRLKMFDAKNGWATTPTAVLRTSDGGLTWSDLTPTEWEPTNTDATSPVQGIFAATFMDPSHVWIVAETDVAQAQADQASTAVSQETVTADGTATINKDNIPQFGTDVYVLSTIDGGQTWMKSNPIGVKDLSSVSDPDFIDAHEGWMEIATNNQDHSGRVDGLVFHTVDGGLKWTPNIGLGMPGVGGLNGGIYLSSPPVLPAGAIAPNDYGLFVGSGSMSGLTVIPECALVATQALPACLPALPSPQQNCTVQGTTNYVALASAMDGDSLGTLSTWLEQQTNPANMWEQAFVLPITGGAYKESPKSVMVTSPTVMSNADDGSGIIPVQMQADPDGDDPSHFFLHLYGMAVAGTNGAYVVKNMSVTSPFAAPLVFNQHNLSAPDFRHIYVTGQAFLGNGKYGDWNLYEFDGTNWITLKNELDSTMEPGQPSVLDESLSNVDFISPTEGFATDKSTLYHITVADGTATWSQIYPAKGITKPPAVPRVPGKIITPEANPGPCGVQIVNIPLPPPPGSSSSKTHNITFINKMNETIWVGQTGPTAAASDGWDGVLAPGASHSVVVSTPNGESWSGRFWGRECPGGTCSDHNGSGNPEPATLAEFDFNAYQGKVFYDISLVDGFNLPMQIVPSDGSPAPDNCGGQACTDLTQSCPAPLQHKDANGNVDICMSACAVATDAGAPTIDQYCCLGAFGPGVCNPDTWPANMDSAKLFKTAYPHDYSYAYDDSTSTYTCDETCSYNIVFGTSP